MLLNMFIKRIATSVRKILRKLIGTKRPLPDNVKFEQLPPAYCDPANLGIWHESGLVNIFNNESVNADWQQDFPRLASLGLPEMTGGVNPGDQRALYYLVRAIKPHAILEIGTHIGSSTVALALAAVRNHQEGVDTRITTVDIRDVNDQQTRPWETAQSPASPATLVHSLGLTDSVEFKTGTAVEFFQADDSQQFGMIFLDGDHSAHAVYQEIPLALRKLRESGVIVLHDVFPDAKPLWKDQAPILGPWSAVARFQAESAPFRVVPLGELPWPTKLGSCVTSLALVSRQ